MKRITYTDGTYILCEDNEVWEYANDPDYYSTEEEDMDQYDAK
jgi:hypothetical protein